MFKEITVWKRKISKHLKLKLCISFQAYFSKDDFYLLPTIVIRRSEITMHTEYSVGFRFLNFVFNIFHSRYYEYLDDEGIVELANKIIEKDGAVSVLDIYWETGADYIPLEGSEDEEYRRIGRVLEEKFKTKMQVGDGDDEE